MKIIDCFMYFNEDLVLDIRLNELDQHVDYFVIVESNFTHSGQEKKFNFDINKYDNFKDKIIYIQIKNKPQNLVKIKNSDSPGEIKSKEIENAIVLENFQRNKIAEGITSFDSNDLILVSDIDEIPDFKKVDLNKIGNSIILFKQYFFHYKLNLYLKNFYYFGSKGCLKKNFISPQWLRNIKNKKYSILRLDTLFSNQKYSNIKILDQAGWHFTNVMDEEKIVYKIKSYLHHADFPENLLKKELFQKLIQERKIMYDHSVDKSSDKFSNPKTLEKFEFNLLPEYIKKNQDKFSEWLI
tara:strand:- start:93 stop:983 length:891 start_codon:yes stop_codon:yes gene_type:complete